VSSFWTSLSHARASVYTRSTLKSIEASWKLRFVRICSFFKNPISARYKNVCWFFFWNLKLANSNLDLLCLSCCSFQIQDLELISTNIDYNIDKEIAEIRFDKTIPVCQATLSLRYTAKIFSGFRSIHQPLSRLEKAIKNCSLNWITLFHNLI
jgi:hypothetical protein